MGVGASYCGTAGRAEKISTMRAMTQFVGDRRALGIVLSRVRRMDPVIPPGAMKGRRKPPVGFEPTTTRLLSGCSTN